MVRPLMQRGVGELEAMFVASRTDLKVLKQLQHELQFRQVPRALALLEEVQAAMVGLTRAASATPPAASTEDSEQKGLCEGSTASKAQPVTPRIEEAQRSSLRESLKPSAKDDATQADGSTIPLDDAYRLLNVTAGSTWEVIEESRRQLVQLAHPERLKSMNADRRGHALAEAKSINAAYAAYAALSRVRSSRS